MMTPSRAPDGREDQAKHADAGGFGQNREDILAPLSPRVQTLPGRQNCAGRTRA